ncbi:MAG: protein-disulfide reductase DsbD [Acinetobacter sp.]|nr:protein-disulfide reductase DsbD [Acinetobacter sp.]
MLLSTSPLTFANSEFLAADQAFQFSAESTSTDQVQLNWKILPHYYLYHDQFKISTSGLSVEFKLPKGEKKDDPTFGITEVHYNQVSTQIKVKPNSNYKITWQGCSQDGLCYPLQSKSISTDKDGLIPQQSIKSDVFSQKNNNDNLIYQGTSSLQDNVINSGDTNQATNRLENTNVIQDIQEADQNPQFENELSDTTSLQWNDDRSFFSLLSEDSVWLNLFIFFVLGILLAFLPCSLPLIPIISSLIIQRRSGFRAATIASAFIISMAAVYGLMGIFVSEIGYSFQRWFQSPWVISFFAGLFVLFALNLFGFFQLSLPQSWLDRLNRFQDQQKSGTLIGTMAMGALSALIVGPCMSAPLAGALLFVSQNHDASMGGLYLFILGLGIGFPLFIACVFGSKLLPKPGEWMNNLKILFGFLMLGLAVYFIRPMLSTDLYYYALALISLIAVLYAFSIIVKSQNPVQRICIALIGFATLYFSYSNIIQGLAVAKIERVESSLHPWKSVTTLQALNNALSEAKSLNKIAVVDVYADWCVACQPIENEVFPRVDVQQSLNDFYLIKLDLSIQNESQDLILKQHEILGPPTLLFFDQNGQEIRKIRLTGTFKAETLIKHLHMLSKPVSN